MNLEESKQWAEEQLADTDEFIERFRQEYRRMSRQQLYDRLSIQDNETIKWICSDIAMPTEDYEICQIAKEILDQRGDKLF